VNLEQTLSTLKFGNLASRIENVVQRNCVDAGAQDSAYRTALKDYEGKLRELEAQMAASDKSGDYLKRIKQLEEQKRLLQQKYANLMKLSMKTSKLADENELYRIELNTEHMRTAGAVDYYTAERGGEFSLKGKRKMLNVTFFESNREYTKALFERDVLAAKQAKLDRLEHDSEMLKRSLASAEAVGQKLSQKLEICTRLLQVMLNSNQSDLSKFDDEHKELLVANALKLIENCKTEQVNHILASDAKNATVLPYKPNSEPALELATLSQHFGALIHQETSFVEDEGMSVDSDPQTLPLKAKTSSSSLFKKKSRRRMTGSDQKSSTEELPMKDSKTMKVSVNYLLQD